MAIFKSFLLGDVRNSVDNLVMYGIRNGYVVRGKRMKVRNPRTVAQQIQRAKMKLLVELSRRFAPVIPLGFPGRKGNATAYNAFVQCNMDAVTVDEQMVATLDYDHLAFSQGALLPPRISVTLDKDSGKLTFTKNEQGRSKLLVNPKDRCYAVVFEKENQGLDIVDLKTRSDAEAVECTLGEDWDTAQLAVCVFAVSASQKQTSPTVCLSLA